MKPVLGAVLAGGASRRFGRDKATVRLGGATLLDRAVATLTGPCEDVVVVASERGSWSWRTLPDAREPCGPLGGIEAALLSAEEDGHAAVAVLACDFPLVTSATIDGLIEAVRAGALTACAAREGDPPFHPLCGVYSVEVLPLASRLLEEGTRAARALHEACAGATLGVPAQELLNVNRPADLDVVREVLLRLDRDGVAGRDGGADLPA